MSELAFVNKKTGRKYKVLDFDQEKGTVRMIGDLGVEFEEGFSREKFERLGYKLETG